MSIQDRQNEAESINKLAAQRLLYSKAKIVRNIGILLVVVLAVFALTGTLFQNKDFSYGVTFAALLTWFVDKFALKKIELKHKSEAATIQEDFDCEVLGLPWPEIKRVKRPTKDRVNQLAVRARKKPKLIDGLKDWYTDLPTDEVLAKIHCQKMNCWWDSDLRQRWLNRLYVSFWLFVVIAFFLAIITGITVVAFIGLMASLIRIFDWGLTEINGQKADVKKLQELHEMLDKVAGDSTVSIATIRDFQDEIYEHRKTNLPVPDWFFRKNRDSQTTEFTKSGITFPDAS